MTKDRSIILTIREYENSVDMPDGERVPYLDPRGGIHLTVHRGRVRPASHALHPEASSQGDPSKKRG